MLSIVNEIQTNLLDMEQKPFRPFQISCGLQEGYEPSARTHPIEHARTVIQQWMEARLKQSKKIAVGTLIGGEFIYPHIQEGVIATTCEPAFHYKGMMREDATDEEAKELLNDLAHVLAEQLNQKRVHVQFCDAYFVMERD